MQCLSPVIKFRHQVLAHFTQHQLCCCCTLCSAPSSTGCLNMQRSQQHQFCCTLCISAPLSLSANVHKNHCTSLHAAGSNSNAAQCQNALLPLSSSTHATLLIHQWKPLRLAASMYRLLDQPCVLNCTALACTDQQTSQQSAPKNPLFDQCIIINQHVYILSWLQP
jgi:hypothetical protein